MPNHLVSIIMPAFNAELYIAEAINSVLNQVHRNWELLIINDGSTDNTESIVQSFSDSRIHYFKQKNDGVSSARNLGILHMKGDFFCFLDADDLMTQESISARLDVFKGRDNIFAVAGARLEVSADLKQHLALHVPKEFNDLTRQIALLNSKAFFGCVVYLIRNLKKNNIDFIENWSHCEDLAFCYMLSKKGKICITPALTQLYRRHKGSAMNDVIGLVTGYENYYKFLIESSYLNFVDRITLKIKICKIGFLSLLNFEKVMAFKWSLGFIFS